MWLPCTVRYRVSCLHTTRKLHTEAIIWYVFYIMEYSLVKEAYQTVMWHGHVPIWYAYAYHTMHTICFSMWYATTHDILHVSSYLTLYVLTLIMAQGRRYSSVGKSSISLRVQIPVGAWLGPPNAWMRGEEITSCESHIAWVSLFYIIVFKVLYKWDSWLVLHTEACLVKVYICQGHS